MAFRQTISFTDPQANYLRREAEKLGIPFADLVRRIIDQYRGKEEPMLYVLGQDGNYHLTPAHMVPKIEEPSQ